MTEPYADNSFYPEGYGLLSTEDKMCIRDSGTMEGNIKPGDITFFRLQSTADTQRKAYVAQGQVLDVQDAAQAQLLDDGRRPQIEQLGLRRPIYRQLAAYGHMGREELGVCLLYTSRCV